MPATTPAAGKSVIVADDTASVRDRFRAALESAGHRARAVSNAAELVACGRADHWQIDLLVLDLRLPQARGVELVRALRCIEGLQAPLLVFGGTIASAEEVRALSALGVAGYVNEHTAIPHIVPALAPHLFRDRYHRRSSPRVLLDVPVACRFGNTIAAAVTLDISRGGMAVQTTSPPDPGTVVKAWFRLPGGESEVDANARVTWTDRRFGMGLEFVRIRASDQAAVDDFVQSHDFSNRTV